MTPPEMTTAQKIHAIESSGLQLAWDGCHKIYFLEDEGRVQDATACGYDLFPAAELRRIISSSCGLVFVTRWGYNNDDFAHHWNILQCTDDIYAVAEGKVQ